MHIHPNSNFSPIQMQTVELEKHFAADEMVKSRDIDRVF